MRQLCAQVIGLCGHTLSFGQPALWWGHTNHTSGTQVLDLGTQSLGFDRLTHGFGWDLGTKSFNLGVQILSPRKHKIPSNISGPGGEARNHGLKYSAGREGEERNLWKKYWRGSRGDAQYLYFICLYFSFYIFMFYIFYV